MNLKVEVVRSNAKRKSYMKEKYQGGFIMMMSRLGILKLIFLLLGIGITVVLIGLPRSGSSGLTVEASAQRKGSVVYAASCVSCHAANGSGSTRRGKRKGAKDLRKSKISLARGISIITNGKSKMPKFKDALTKAEIKAVNRYVRRFRQ